MTWNDQNPLVNPLNRRTYQRASFRRGGAELEVPNQDVPLYGSQEYIDAQNRLKVPNQDVPLGDQLCGCGFLPGSDSVFRTSDGDLFDFRTGRILRKARSRAGYWGDPGRTISMNYINDYDDTGPTIGDMLNGMAAAAETQLSPIDPKSAAYWLKAEAEAEKLKAGMTDAQREMIADFERHFPRSRLIEESMKQKGKKQ